MDFKKFCEENLLFGFTPPFPELTEAFYMDCFINHQLQELLYPKGIKKLPENSGKTLEKDFDYMLSSLIKRIPSYNKNIKKSGNVDKDEDVKKRMSDKLKNISIDCKKWFFSILYSKNPDMCRNLAPIITFILVDSYPFFEDKLKTSETATQFDLYGYILECLNGKHQEAYLFSLLRNSPPSKKKASPEIGEMQLKKIIEKVFRLEHDESVCSTIDPNGNRVEYKIDYYTLWKPGIVPNYKIEKKNNPEYYSATFFNSIPLSIEDDPATYSVKHEDWIAKSYFDLFESMHLESIYSSNQSRDRKKYNIKSSVWADLLDFDYIDSEQLASIESILKRNFNGKRGGYNLYEYKCGENIISLICYLNDLERENYFKMKYDRTLIIYTLNKMTQWITPFTTPTEQNVFPAYNPDLVFTCHCYNHASDGYGEFRWRELDFEANLLEEYRDISYKKFISWYDATSASDKKGFDDQIEKYTKEIFYSFIYCPTDYIYFPINRLSIAPVDFKTNPIKDSKTDCLGFYYCLCDRFYYHIGPQITQSFIQTCEKWLNDNNIWSEFKKIYEVKGEFNLSINSKAYSGERSSERLAEDLEQILGNAFGKYLWDHLDEYSDEYWDENGDDSWEVNIPYDAFGGRLISENIDEIMGKFKKTLSEDPKLDYLYIIFSKI